MSASILVVDDDPLLVQLMGAMLCDLGRIRFATSGEAALGQVAAERPDLILLDAEMPGMGGFEFCSTIKSLQEYSEIPVIFVTAHDEEEFEVRGFDVGAADFIRKPVSRPILRARVQTQLRLTQALDTIGRMALTDALTGLINRRAFDGLMMREWRQAARERKRLGMLMIDVDCFKDYNDSYGDPAGDACLASVACALQSALLRPLDTVARYGAEEFAVLLPDASEHGVRTVGARLVDAVLALRIPNRHGVAGEFVTISVGGALLDADPGTGMAAAGDALGKLVRDAGEALYSAKRLGRARFCLAPPDGVAAAAP